MGICEPRTYRLSNFKGMHVMEKEPGRGFSGLSSLASTAQESGKKAASGNHFPASHDLILTENEHQPHPPLLSDSATLNPEIISQSETKSATNLTVKERLLQFIFALLMGGLALFLSMFFITMGIASYELVENGKETTGYVIGYRQEMVRRTRKSVGTAHMHLIYYDGHSKKMELDMKYPIHTEFPILYLEDEPDEAIIFSGNRNFISVFYAECNNNPFLLIFSILLIIMMGRFSLAAFSISFAD